MKEGLNQQYEHELTLFTQEEFLKRFENFHLIFMVENPQYLSNIKKFLQASYPVEFQEIKKILKDTEGNQRNSIIIPKNKDLLYKIYLALRNEGHFSNKDLGLTYW